MLLLFNCGPITLDANDTGQKLVGEVELPSGQDETFIEGIPLGTDHQVSQSAPSCDGSNVDGWCNPDGKTGCREGKLFGCAMGQRCSPQRYLDREGAFAGCTWEDGQAMKAPPSYCSAHVGGYCTGKRSGVRCDKTRKVSFYCAGTDNTCEVRQCGRMTLVGCSQNHPCNGIRGTFAACYPGQKKTCWWNGYRGHQRCESGNWSWMCYAYKDDYNGGGGQCWGGQTKTCWWNGYKGHQTCEGGKWSWLCHTNGGGDYHNGDPHGGGGHQQCNWGQTRSCQWNGYHGHQTCDNGKWSWLCHVNKDGSQHNQGWDPHDPHAGHHDPHANHWNPNGGNGSQCHPGQTRHCNWKGHPGIQKCHSGSWSYLCYTYN
jgi:hypothetical protein